MASSALSEEELTEVMRGIADHLRARYGGEVGFVLLAVGRPVLLELEGQSIPHQPFSFHTNASTTGPILALLSKGLEYLADIEQQVIAAPRSDEVPN